MGNQNSQAKQVRMYRIREVMPTAKFADKNGKIFVGNYVDVNDAAEYLNGQYEFWTPGNIE